MVVVGARFAEGRGREVWRGCPLWRHTASANSNLQYCIVTAMQSPLVLNLLNFLTSPAVFRDGRKVWADAAAEAHDAVLCFVLGDGFCGTPALNRLSLGHGISHHSAPSSAMKVALSVHPKGLGPRQAAKAWFLSVKKKLS